MATDPMAQSGETTTARPRARPPRPVVLRGVTYDQYVALRDEPANDGLRMTYYDGTLELMSPEFIHEVPSYRIGLFIPVVAEELDIPFLGAGSTTIRRGTEGQRKGKGKEPDECFYFGNLGAVLDRERIDLERDPPPDLWIEVDHRSSSRGRLPLYAALGVPEVWRFWARSGRVWFGRLSAEGSYEPVDRSLCLPMLTPALVKEALSLGSGVDQLTWLKRLRPWVRANLAPGEGGAP